MGDPDRWMNPVFRYGGGNLFGVVYLLVHSEITGKIKLDIGDMGDPHFISSRLEGQFIGQSLVLILSVTQVRGSPVGFVPGFDIYLLVLVLFAFHITP